MHFITVKTNNNKVAINIHHIREIYPDGDGCDIFFSNEEFVKSYDSFQPTNHIIQMPAIIDSYNPDRIEIKEDMLVAIKVIFLQPIFEDDFPERGMKAWLTGVDRMEDEDCWKLYFDFTEFEEENDKYLRCVYYTDNHRLTETAKDAGEYSNKYAAFFGDLDESGGTFEEQIKEFLKVI